MEKNKKENLIRQLIKLIQFLILFLQKQLLAIKGGKGFDEFALALRKRESGNNYKIVNPYGYLGAYQFGMARLCDLGYTERIPKTTGYSNRCFHWKQGYSREYFLNNPDFQDRVFKEHVKNLVSRIKLGFSQYLGKKINGAEITLSGLVAGAHLGGIGGISNFLKGLYDSQDQFGTKVSDYIKKFTGYNLEDI